MTSIEVFLITMLRMGELELQDAGQLDNVGNYPNLKRLIAHI